MEMYIKTWTVFCLLLALSWAQNKHYQTFDWRPVKIQRQTSALPYQAPAEATTTSYVSRYFDTSAPYQHGYFQDTSGGSSYNSQPNSGPGPYSGPDSSYSADYPKPVPYQYPDDSGSYEQYGGYTRDDTFNVTAERYGGFGGTGDTRGFGAYDYPKKVHEEVPQDLHHEPSSGGTAYPDLLRIGRERVYHRRNPMHVHPLPPPL